MERNTLRTLFSSLLIPLRVKFSRGSLKVGHGPERYWAFVLSLAHYACTISDTSSVTFDLIN